MASDNKSGRGKLIEAGCLLLISQLAVFLVATATIDGSLSLIRIAALLINIGVISVFYRSLFLKTPDLNTRALTFYKVALIAFTLAVSGVLLSLWRIAEFYPSW
jgi:hypothetical protein